MKTFAQLLLVEAILVVLCFSEDIAMDHMAINQKQRSLLMDHLDVDYEPCTDFYKYTCYKLADIHEEYGHNYTTIAEMLNYEVNMEIIEYLEKTPVKDMPGFVEMLKNFYVSCTESQEFSPLKFMHWMEREENFKWALFTPNDGSENVEEFSWPATLALFHKYGFNDVFLEDFIQYLDLSSIMINLKKPNCDTYSFVNPNQLEEYNISIPLPQGTMDFMKLWEIIDKFEDKLNKIRPEKEEKIFTYNELPYPWLKQYITALLKPETPDDQMKVNIDNIAYMEAFDNLLKEYDGLFLCRYLEVRFLQHLEMANRRSSPNECMTNARTLPILPMVIEWIYQQLHPELLEEIPKIQQMFKNVVKNIKKTLQMDKYGLIPEKFFTKLENMHLMVGSLPKENARFFLEIYYGYLQLTTNDYYGNYMRLLELKPKLEYNYVAYISNPYRSREFVFTPPSYTYDSEIYPKYYPSMNALMLPLALLRPPVYHVAFEDIFKQSSLATLMGMGIFETFGKQYGFHDGDVQKIAGATAMHASFEIFFSSLTEEEISKYLTMFGFTTLQQLKQMFILNAVYYKCQWYSANTAPIDSMVNNLSYFLESYDCKLESFLKMF
ncbi:uncharacterized protein [Musca autumnalis]|uniref:uncharacterized protein n=1 Tax=Musca autumnalis TaxID=221902 RepID=UPI003CE8CB90